MDIELKIIIGDRAVNEKWDVKWSNEKVCIFCISGTSGNTEPLINEALIQTRKYLCNLIGGKDYQ